MGDRTCPGCGGPLPAQKYHGNPRKWCSEACRVKHYSKTHPDYRERCAERAAERHRESYEPVRYELTCAVCTSSFVASRGNARYCSDKCRWRQHYLGRYARRAGAERTRYSFLEIAERDGWTCALCDTPVDAALAYPDRQAGSIDHAVPLSRGGVDTSANVQLAHLECNWRKNNRITEPAKGTTPDMGGEDGRTRASAKAGQP